MKTILTDKQNPLICVPVTGDNEQAIIEQCNIAVNHQPDMIEWRADFFAGLDNTNAVLKVITEMTQLSDIPVLFTIRAQHEGGETISLDDEEKLALLMTVCEQSGVDVIDFESSNNESDVEKVREASRQHGKKLILSYHDFEATPEKDVMMEKAQLAKRLGADIAKMACMPTCKADVFRLLEVTSILDKTLDIPLITMSMGEIGALSRMIGWTFGSALTFGVAAEASAPGQIPVKELRDVIQSMQRLLPEWE